MSGASAGPRRTRPRGGRAGTLRDEEALRWLARHRSGAAPVDALAFVDRLPPVGPDELPGRWRGRELPTGSRFGGLLAAHGWYGKEVVDAETVHPLLVRGRDGVPHPVDPARLPVSLLLRRPAAARGRAARAAGALVRPLLATSRPAARVRAVEHRGVVTAALLYDALPVVDVLRRVGPGVLLGVLDLRGLPEPFFFVLERDRS